MEPNSDNNPSSKQSREEEILELAKKELLRDIKCASIRAEQFGAHSWAKPQKYVPSKRFLKHLIVNDSRFNNRKEQQSFERREKGRDRRTSAYVEDKRKHSDKGYFSHYSNKKKREISPEGDRYRSIKCEKSSSETEKKKSRWEKWREDSSPEIDRERSSFKFVDNKKEKLVEKDYHSSSSSKYHKKHLKKKKSKK